MPTGDQQEFAEAVLNRYENMRTVKLAQESYGEKSLRASAATTPALGHPQFAGLELGDYGSCRGVSVFIDLRRFTASSTSGCC